MNFLLHTMQSLDQSIYHFLNGLAGNWLVDRLVVEQESNRLLKGAVFVAIYWYFWFRPGSDQEKRRKRIIAIMVGILLAIPATRLIALTVPFRIRPIDDPTLVHYLSVESSGWEQWSGFPSETATYICALAFGIAYLSRRLTIPVILYVAVWICLPRLYLGIHYASDIVVGAAVAVTAVWAALRIEWLRTTLASRLLALMEASPQVFYPAAFLVSYEMASVFSEIRSPMHVVLSAARQGYLHEVGKALVVLATLGAVAMAIVVVFLYRKHWHRSPPAARQMKAGT